MLFPRVLPHYPFGLYCVFRKGPNHEPDLSNVMADDFVRLIHTKNNTLCDVKHLTSDRHIVPTIVLDRENFAQNFPLHNVDVSKVQSFKGVTAAEVEDLPCFSSEHHCTSATCIIDALDIQALSRTDPAFTKYDYLDLAVDPNQADTVFAVGVLQVRAEVAASDATATGPQANIDAVVTSDDTIATAPQLSNTSPTQAKVVSTPLRKVRDLMKASPSKVPPPTTAGMEVFDSSVVEYGPVKTHRPCESASTTHRGLMMRSGGHTPNTSISSTYPEEIHEDSRAVANYPKTFVQSEMPFAGREVTNKLHVPHDATPASSSSNVPNQTSVIDGPKASSTSIVEDSVPSGMEGDETLMESKPIKKSQRKKGRERKAAQALKKQEQATATASSTDKLAIEPELINGSASATTPLAEISTVEVKQTDDHPMQEGQAEKSNPLTKSQRKKNRQRKGKIAKEMKQQQEPAPAASSSSSSKASTAPDSSKLISQDQAENETLKQPDQGKKAASHAKPAKKAAVISKSALQAKAKGISAETMPANTVKPQYSLGSLVEPGRPRPKASTIPKLEPAGMPKLSEFNFEARSPGFNVPPREPHLISNGSIFGNIASGGQPRSGSSTPPVSKPVTPPSTSVFDPVFASPLQQLNFNALPGQQPSSDCRLRLPEPIVKAKEPAPVQHDDATISQTTTKNANEEAGTAGTGTHAANDENQAGQKHVTGATVLVVPPTSEESIPALMGAVITCDVITTDESREEVGVSNSVAPTSSYQDEVETDEHSNIADTAGNMVDNTIAGTIDISAHNKEDCIWMDGVYPGIRQNHDIQDNVLSSPSDQHKIEYPEHVPEAHIDQSPEKIVASETPTETEVSTDIATESLTDEEPQSDEERRVVTTDADDVFDAACCQEQASHEANVDQKPALASATDDKRLYEFSDDEVPSDPTLPQNRPDHVVDTDQQSAEFEQAKSEATTVPDVQRGYDPAIYEFSEDERPTDPTMPQNRPAHVVDIDHQSTESQQTRSESNLIADLQRGHETAIYEFSKGERPMDPTMPQNRPQCFEDVVDDRLSVHESSDNERSEDSAVRQIHSDVLGDGAIDCPSEASPDQYVLTAEDEYHMETLSEELVKVFNAVKQKKKSENSSRVTSGSLSGADSLGSLPSVTSVGTRTGNTSPSDPAKVAKAGATISMSPAAFASSHPADETSQATHGTVDDTDDAQPPAPSSTKALDRGLNSPYTTSCGLPEEKGHVGAEEAPASAWAGKQALHIVKVAVTVTLLPVSLAVEAATMPIRVAKTALSITRWAIARFGPDWLV